MRGNLLCVTWSAGRGHVFLYDLEARQRVSSWTTPVGPSGYSDAGGVAVDQHFRIFVADAHNHCVRRYNAFGQHLGDLGLPPPDTGDRGRDRPGVLHRPHAVCVLDERVFVAAGERERRRAVQAFTVDGRALRGLPSEGDTEARWGAPRGIWADARGLVVSDTLRGRLQCFRPDGGFRQSIAVPPPEDQVETVRPGAVVRLSDGAFVTIDHGDIEPRLVGIRPDGTGMSLGDLPERCEDPLALACDAGDRIYVLDRDGERVVRATRDGFDRVLVDLAEHDGDAPGGPG